MIQSLCTDIVVTLGHFLWQASLVGVGCYLCCLAMAKRSASARYLVFTTGMFCLPLLVIPTFLVVSSRQQDNPGRGQPNNASSLSVNQSVGLDLIAQTPKLTSSTRQKRSPTEAPTFSTVSERGIEPTSTQPDAKSNAMAPKGALTTWSHVIVLLYGWGVLTFLIRLAIALRGGYRLKTESQLADDPLLVRIVMEQSMRIGLRSVPVIRYCVHVVSPTVVGIIRPTILLPAAYVTGLQPAQLTAVITHELAHIRRHDLLIHLIQRMIESLFFFHPVVWIISREMDREREICCDESVLSAGHGRTEYAGALIRAAELGLLLTKQNSSKESSFSMAASGNKDSQFQERVERLMSPSARSSRIRLGEVGWLVVVAFLCIGPMFLLLLQTPVEAEKPLQNQHQPAHQIQSPTSKVKNSGEADGAEEVDANPKSATEVGRSAHKTAAAIDASRRFYLRCRNVSFNDRALSTPDDAPLPNLLRALDTPIDPNKAYPHETELGWDEQHFIESTLPTGGQNAQEHWGTREAAGERNGTASERRHVLQANASELWQHIMLSNPNFILMTRHEFWWGDNGSGRQILAGTDVPPSMAEYTRLPDEQFDGELCGVVESLSRKERMWIGKKSGLIRGYGLIDATMNKQVHQLDIVAAIAGKRFADWKEYREWYATISDQISQQQKWEISAAWAKSLDWTTKKLTLLIRFRDYREVAPGIMWPFREDRAGGTMKNGKFIYHKTTCETVEIAFDRDLKDRIEKMQPKAGEHVQDQRFHEYVDYKYSSNRTTADILKLVDEKHETLAQDQLRIERKTKPYDSMLGKPAPQIPLNANQNWVGGKVPNLAGKPYLIRFWADWSSPCERDIPVLQQFVNAGGVLVGLHPKADADKVMQAMRQSGLTHPTYIAKQSSPYYRPTIGAFPAPFFPYYLLVDGTGNVAAHGFLSDENFDLLAKHRDLLDGRALSNAETTNADVAMKPLQDAPEPTEVAPELMEIQILVTYKGTPVSGASAVPEYLGGRGGNEATGLEPKLTNEKGIATFQVKQRYGEDHKTRAVHVEVLHPAFCRRYEHNAPIENGMVKISLTKGFRVLAGGIDAETQLPLEDLFAGNGYHNGQWTRQDDGRLLSPMLSYNNYGHAFRLVRVRDENAIGFSDVVSVRPRRRQRQALLTKIPVYQPISLSGELDATATRPIRNGRVMIVARGTKLESGKRKTIYGTDWVDWTPINTDGTFQFKVLPRNSEVELLAICDGFVSSSTSAQGMMGIGITPGMYLGNLQPAKVRLETDDKEIRLKMRPTSVARVRLLDPNGKAVQGAKVLVRSHHSWRCSLGYPVFQNLRTIDRLLGRKQGVSRKPANGITNQNGIATLRNMIPSSYMVTVQHPTLEMRPNPHTPQVRDVDVPFPNNKDNEVTIKLVPKGTTHVLNAGQ